jgi:hypothetical protein
MPKIPRQFSILSTQAHVDQHRYERRSIGARLLGALRTFLFVAPLTLLIWIYADRELIVKLDDIGVAISVKSSQSDRIVTLLSPTDGQIHLDLEGAQSSLENVRDSLINRRDPLLLLLPEDIKPGDAVDVDAINMLTRSDLFASSTVQVARVRPAIRVRVEKRISKSLKIVPNPKTPFVGDVKFEPETAEVSGPSGEIEKLSENAVIYANLSSFQTRTVGEYTGLVPVILSESLPGLDFPKTVTAKVKVLESKPITLKSVPILIQIPTSVMERKGFSVKVSRVTLPNVLVSGPPEAIEQITKGNFSPAAIIELTPDEATASGEKTKRISPANYRMPKDVSVVNTEDETVLITIDPGT